MSSELGSRIRRFRVERGLTQTELAGARMSVSYVSLLESGRRTPTAEVLEYLAGVLGCGVAALTDDSESPTHVNAELLIRRGEWESRSGSLSAAHKHLEEGVALARDLGLKALVVRGTMASATAMEMEGRMREAVEIWERLLADSENDRHIPRAAVAVALSRCCRELGDLDRAIEVGEMCWQELSTGQLAYGPTEDAVVVGSTLLSAYLELGDLDRSRALSEALLALAAEVDTPKATGAAYWNAAIAAEAEGRTADALRLAERAEASMAMTEDVRNRARLQTALAGLHLRMHPPETQEAIRLLTAAEPVLEQFGSRIDVGYCRTELARAHLQDQNFERARRLAEATASDLEAAGDGPLELARTLMVMALAESGLGRFDEAKPFAQRAADLLEQAGATRQAASRWTELAELCVELGDQAGAIDAYRRATDLLGTRRTSGIDTTKVLPQVQPRQAAG